MSTSRIVELSARIAANTAKLDNYLLARGLPTPSFDVDGPRGSLVPKDELDIENSRLSIAEDALELRRLALGPKEHIRSFGHNELLSQQAIVRFRLAHSFPVGSTATFAEIAAASGLKETTVRQIIRHAIMQDFFLEPRPGVVAHNAASRLLVEDPVLYDWFGASTDDMWQAAAHTCEALTKYPGSEELNETGFAITNRTDKPMFEVLSQFPERARRWANAMRSFTQGAGSELRHVVDNFDWGALGSGTVVDVGGSQGFACFAIARKYPTLNFVVQDVEPVIEAAKDDVPPDVQDRIEFMSHDFLTDQTVQGADVYLLRAILHNWPDKYCIKILQCLIPALQHGSKILVVDVVLPPPGALPKWKERSLRNTDLVMLEMQNARERELEDWLDLFQRADPGFEFQGAKQPAGSNFCILILEWKENGQES